MITDIPKVCETANAIVTYKQSGWKTTFQKYKEKVLEEKKAEEDKLKAKLTQQIFSGMLKNKKKFKLQKMILDAKAK